MPLAKPTKPDAITAVPTPVPLRTDRANFAARGDAMMGWFPTGIAGVNTTLTYFGNAVNFVEQEANEAEASATAAAASNVAAGANAAAAAASAGATVWVTGTTYAAGNVRYSPTNFQTYRDTVGGVSNTDPASDTSGRWISAMLPSVEAIGLPAMPPTAVFNFASGVIDRRFVESRSTDGTRYNIFGNLETLAAGVAKSTYNPATNACEGYLAQPAATYLAMRSTEMDNGSYWAVNNVTVTPAAARGIDGAMSMFKVEASTTAVTNYTRMLSATATAQYYVIRAAKGSGATDCNIFGAYNNTTVAPLVFVSINYDTGVITHSVGSGATATDVGKGIWEIRIPLVSGVSIGNSLTFYAGFTGNAETAGEYAYVGFPDVADKPNLTHIPTAGSNITTVAGGLTLDLAAHDEIINPQGFTVVCAYTRPEVSFIGSRFLCTIYAGASNTYAAIYTYGTLMYATVYEAGIETGSISQFTIAAVGERVSVAVSFGDGYLRMCQAGGSPTSTALSSMPTYTAFTAGALTGVAGYEADCPIEHITPFPRACTAGELTALANNI